MDKQEQGISNGLDLSVTAVRTILSDSRDPLERATLLPNEPGDAVLADGQVPDKKDSGPDT